MTRWMAFVSGLGFALWSAGVYPQEMTVGFLLDRGGRKLNREQMMAIIPGSTSSGRVAHFPNRTGTVTYYPDKTSKGSTSPVEGTGGVRGTFGTWSIDDSGSLCSVFKTTSGGGATQCTAWFNLGEKYYTARSTDRDEVAHPRELTR